MFVHVSCIFFLDFSICKGQNNVMESWQEWHMTWSTNSPWREHIHIKNENECDSLLCMTVPTILVFAFDSHSIKFYIVELSKLRILKEKKNWHAWESSYSSPSHKWMGSVFQVFCQSFQSSNIAIYLLISLLSALTTIFFHFWVLLSSLSTEGFLRKAG